MTGRINYIDDNGEETFTKYRSIDLSHPSVISFKTLDKNITITIPISRFIKAKDYSQGDASE